MAKPDKIFPMLVLTRHLPIMVTVCFLVVFTRCRQQETENTLFTQLSAQESGIDFSNDIFDSDSTHSFINEFGYMGGGVGIGDFNNDGLKDIFFSGNQVSCRMYINKGNNRFEDITRQAGLTTAVWATGVSVVDINADGYDDLYVCTYGKDLLHRTKNLLFINQHNLTFREQAEAYGIADTSYSSQAVFFDYDKDGDLDMYLANYMLSGATANTILPKNTSGYAASNDRLYRNDGDSLHKGHPFFSDVTLRAGIKEDGFGLGVTVSDFNGDGWPDVFVANDFISNDELWLNNKNGTFSNSIGQSMGHQSYSSMGADAADINNDGLPDITVLDMLPEYNERKKTSFMFMNYDRYEAERAMGYEPEFARNMLHLNNGNDPGTGSPFFSEIGQLAGIAATDWSWSILLADFDNDGWKDMHITNGIGRDFINGDFLEFSNTVFANQADINEQRRLIREKLASIDHVSLHNYLYRNNRDYTFTDISADAGTGELSMSNGAACADLDNDGDLDLVVNNINKKAFVLINNTRGKNSISKNRYLSVQLKGDSLNRKGVGAKVLLYAKGERQMQEQNPVRGYYSSVDQQLLFGTAQNSHIDSVVVIWPDQKRQTKTNLQADTTIRFSWADAVYTMPGQPAGVNRLFSDITATTGLAWLHRDVSFNDFNLQRLLPRKYSQEGPFVATGDVDNNGTVDFFAGGGFNFSGRVFLQGKSGGFHSKDIVDSVKMEEDADCLLFDADGDKDPDLLVTCGDVRYEENSVHYIPRLYLNDGKGNFSLQPAAIPAHVKTIAGCVTAGDFNGDGLPDLFIGGRVSRQYPISPHSYILENNNGVFKDVTANVCAKLQRPGMVTGAVWTDFDSDRQTDLVIAGEWMPVRFFRNDKGILQEVTASAGLSDMNGMWRSLAGADVDKDGDTDFIAGNLGLNCIYHTNAKEPMQLVAADIDGNGTIDPVMFYFIKDKDESKKLYPAINRNQLAEQVPGVKKKFLRHTDFAKASSEDIFTGKSADQALRLYCEETASCYLENLGNGKFRKHVLPKEAQFAPVNAIICEDFDNDGTMDLLLAGNDYQPEVITGRYDASYGCFLKGTGKQSFKCIPPVASGFVLRGDVKDMAIIRSLKGERMVVAAVNNDSLRIFRVNVHLRNK